MKATKKLLALILAVCMLIGMPLSVNVSAFGTADTDAPAVKAIIMPDYIADELGVAHDKGILLYFNKAVTIDPSKQRVTFGYVHTTKGTADAGYGGNSILNVTTTIQQSGSVYYVDLAEFTHATVKTVSDLFAGYNSWGASYKSAFEVVARIVEKESGPDNKLNGITYGDDNVAWPGSAKTYTSCQANCNINTGNAAANTLDYLDVPIQNALTLESAVWKTDTSVEVTFSQIWKVRNSAGLNAVYLGVRLVNADGKVMHYNPNAEGDKYSTVYSTGAETVQCTTAPQSESKATQTLPLAQKSTVAIDGFAVGSSRSLSWFNAHLKACSDEHPDETFTISFVVESKESGTNYFFPARGEATNNWLISSVHEKASGMPLLATHLASSVGMDTAMVEITDPINTVILESVKILDSYWVDLTFSEAVTLTGQGFGLAIVQNGNIVANMKPNSWNSAQQGTTYSRTWRIGLTHDTYGTDNQEFIKGENWIDNLEDQEDTYLCFFIREDSGTAGVHNSLIENVYTKYGKKLKNTSSVPCASTAKETLFVPVEDQVFLKPTAYVANDTYIIVQYNGQGTSKEIWKARSYLAAYDAQGNMVQDAKWKLTLQQNYMYGTTIMNCAFSLPTGTTYKGIVAQLDAANIEGGYTLKMIVEDPDTGVKDGIIDDFRNYNPYQGRWGLYVRADELCSTDKDVAVVPFGEIVTIESVDLYDSGQAIITFSHAIDIEKLADHALNDGDGNYKDFFLTISNSDANSYIKDTEDSDGDENVDEPLKQVAMGDIRPYGDSGKKIALSFSAANYASMLETLNDNPEGREIRMRIEMPTGWDSATGELPLHQYIVATDSNVRPLYITMRNESRVWTDVNIIEAGNNVISVDGEFYADILEGIAEAQPDSDLILLNNATIDDSEGDYYTSLPAGATLNLNGKTLTIAENNVLNATVADILDITDGGAKIVVNTDDSSAAIQFNAANTQLALYDKDNAAWHLFNYEFINKGTLQGTKEDDTITDVQRYGVSLQFTNRLAYSLMSKYGRDCGLTLTMHITSAENHVYTTADPNFGEWLAVYGQECIDALDDEDAGTTTASKTFVLSVSGMDALKEKYPTDSLIVTATLTSNVAITQTITVK